MPNNPNSTLHSIGILGSGRMGQALCKLAADQGLQAVMVNRASTPHDWELLYKTQVWLDFAIAEGFLERLDLALEMGKPLVIGTTGLHHLLPMIQDRCNAASSQVIMSSNYSLGVGVFLRTCRFLYQQMSYTLDPFCSQIDEIHHIEKKDTPSGTALQLQQKLLDLSSKPIPIHSERLLDVHGIHKLTLKSPLDEITLSHQASSREGFASGAIVAARWILNRQGFFTFDDLLDNILTPSGSCKTP